MAREVLERLVSAGARARFGDLFVFEFGNVERPAWEQCREARRAAALDYGLLVLEDPAPRARHLTARPPPPPALLY